jgi:hypothetical protein
MGAWLVAARQETCDQLESQQAADAAAEQDVRTKELLEQAEKESAAWEAVWAERERRRLQAEPQAKALREAVADIERWVV